MTCLTVTTIHSAEECTRAVQAGIAATCTATLAQQSRRGTKASKRRPYLDINIELYPSGGREALGLPAKTNVGAQISLA